MSWRRSRLLISSFLMWLMIVYAGFGVLWRHAYTPGVIAHAPESWPIESRLDRDPKTPTMIVLAHPKCPCTRATIGELSLVMAQCQGKVQTQVLFYRSSKFDQRWAHTDIWETAAAIPGVRVREDLDGTFAESFGAQTSGQVLLYSASGKLIFEGGITGARGHMGMNAGRMIVLMLVGVAPVDSMLNGGHPEDVRTPVYGCSLLDLQSNGRRCDESEEDAL